MPPHNKRTAFGGVSVTDIDGDVLRLEEFARNGQPAVRAQVASEMNSDTAEVYGEVHLTKDGVRAVIVWLQEWEARNGK